MNYTDANGRDGASNHRRLDCLLIRLFRHRSKKTSKLRVTGLCEGNSPVTGEYPSQWASIAENVSIWWRHHGYNRCSSGQCQYCAGMHTPSRLCNIGYPITTHITLTSRLPMTFFSVNQPFWKFAQSMTVSLSKRLDSWNGCYGWTRFRDMWG